MTPIADPTPARHPVRTALRIATTVILAVACGVLSLLLWQARREIGKPPPSYSIVLTPADALTEIRGGAGAETEDTAGAPRSPRPGQPGPPDRQVFRPPRGHRLLLTLELPPGTRTRIRAASDAEDPVWAAEVLPPAGEGPGSVERVAEVTPSALRVELPPDPVPGPYRVNLYRFEGREPRRVARYGYRIGLPEEVIEDDPEGRPEGGAS